MKLIDREPTPEMIATMWTAYNAGDVVSVVRIFRAAYDAAPEVKQEPVKAVEVMVSAVGSTYTTPAKDYYILPPDAQAEIAKSDARIAKLHTENAKLKAELKAITAVLDDAMKGETCYQNTNG